MPMNIIIQPIPIVATRALLLKIASVEQTRKRWGRDTLSAEPTDKIALRLHNLCYLTPDVMSRDADETDSVSISPIPLIAVHCNIFPHCGYQSVDLSLPLVSLRYDVDVTSLVEHAIANSRYGNLVRL